MLLHNSLDYQNKYNSTKYVFLLNVGFNSSIKILLCISNLKIHVLLAIGKFSEQRNEKTAYMITYN